MAVIGPLAASTRDLNLFMKSILDLKPWKTDPTLIPLPWKEEKLAKEDLIVGILYDDGWVKPAPPLLRALKETAAKLQKSGVKVVKMDPYDHHRGFEIVVSMYFADGAKEDIEVMASTGEPSMPLTDFVLKSFCGLDIWTDCR
jgi:amidase